MGFGPLCKRCGTLKHKRVGRADGRSTPPPTPITPGAVSGPLLLPPSYRASRLNNKNHVGIPMSTAVLKYICPSQVAVHWFFDASPVRIPLASPTLAIGWDSQKTPPDALTRTAGGRLHDSVHQLSLPFKLQRQRLRRRRRASLGGERGRARADHSEPHRHT